MTKLLVEIRTEELPPAQLSALVNSFPDSLLTALQKNGFATQNSRRMENKKLGTPRRLIALLENINTASPTCEILRRGPQIAACHDSDNKPTKALVGFMQSVGATCEKDLITAEEKGKTYIAWKGEQPGRKLADELAAIVERVLLDLPAPRLMRWGDNDFKFIRPVRGVLMLHGEKIIKGKIMNVVAGNSTVGHPILSNKEIKIPNVDSYEKIMQKNNIIVDSEARFLNIRNQLWAVAKKTKSRPNILSPDEDWNDSTIINIPYESDLALWGEVSDMCENPVVYVGAMNDNISLPEFCIIECMKKHQRFFPLYNPDTGKLSVNYLVVADNKPDNAAPMIAGFNSVLRARLRDLQFYYDEDKKLSLNDYVEKLKSIVYHQKLGSQFDRVCRLRKIAFGIAELMNLTDKEKSILDSATLICKADLPTLMISEYPEFEGKMAAEYFCNDKETAAIVRQHNAPTHKIMDLINDETPRIYYALVLAENLEKLIAMFGIGEKPDGGKDPHGLRIAATKIVHILLKKESVLSGNKLLQIARTTFNELPHFDANEIWDFIAVRARYGLIGGHASGKTEEDIKQRLLASRAVQNAVFARRNFLLSDIQQRYFSVSSFTRVKKSAILIATDKRIKNIFRKSEMDAAHFVAPDDSLFEHEEERALWNCIKELQTTTAAQIQQNDFDSALQTLTTAAEPINNFFDKVLVNAADTKIRDNRFALLAQLHTLLNQVCDISKLESPRV